MCIKRLIGAASDASAKLAMSFVIVMAVLGPGLPYATAADLGDRYLVLNLQQDENQDETFKAIASLATNRTSQSPRIGVGIIVSYLAAPRDQCLMRLRECFRLAELHDVAVVVQLDGEQWWQGRPDLWNWWDANQPGFDPNNASNVEWSGWGPEHALKIAWRNWGRQIRVLPPPNLMSPHYRAACHEEMKVLLEEIVRWRESLRSNRSHLFIGVKVGWESSVGVNAYYYPNGNQLLDRDPAKDPSQAIQDDRLPSRGFQPIGYAAVSTARLASSGELQESHLTEVVQNHLADLAAVVSQADLPRHQIFVHCGGWAPGETLYSAALNPRSCPGWSFYKNAADPKQDETAMAVLRRSDAPYWAAPEWYPPQAKTADDWSAAIRTTLLMDHCRYLCVYNWRDVAKNSNALAGIKNVMDDSVGGR